MKPTINEELIGLAKGMLENGLSRDATAKVLEDYRHRHASQRERGRPPHQEPNAKAQQILALHSQGVMQTTIAQQIGVSRQRVWAVIQRWGKR